MHVASHDVGVIDSMRLARPAWVTLWLWLVPGPVTNNVGHRWFYTLVATVLLAVESILLANLGIAAQGPYLAVVALWGCLCSAGWHSLAGGLMYASLLWTLVGTGIAGHDFSLPVIGVYVVAAEWVSRSWFVPAGGLLFVTETALMARTQDSTAQFTAMLLGVGLTIAVGLVARWQILVTARLRADSLAARQAAITASERVRRELAAELHDTLAKDLARVTVTAQRLATRNVDASMRAELENLAELSGIAARRLRPIILGLDAPRLDAPLSEVIHTCRIMLSSRSITIDHDIPDALDPLLTQRQRILAGLIIRECATNVLKYAPCGSTANLVIELSPEGAWLITMTNQIADTAEGAITGGFGLAHLTQRLETEGGRLQFGKTGTVWMTAATLPADTQHRSR